MELHAGVLTVNSFNDESVYDDGQRDENAENHHSSRLELSGGGAWIEFGETGSTLMQEMFCFLPPPELSLIFSVCLELAPTDANSSGPGAAEASRDGENPARSRFSEVPEGQAGGLVQDPVVVLAHRKRIYAFD